MTRARSWLCQLLLGAGLHAACAAALAAPAARPATNPILAKLEAIRSRPNIIFILADDLGYGDLGCYGQKRIQTPHLDRLAAEGMRFTQCYAGSPVCAPSRAVLMTGRHAGHTIIRGNAKVPLGRDEPCVAEVLRRAGYQTGAVGKWGLGLAGSGATPNDRGFEEWFGYLDQTHAHDYYPTQLYRNDAVYMLQKNLGGARGQYSHDLFTQVASNFVRVAKYRPFFLYLAYTIPHANNELKERGMEVPSDAPYSKEDWPQPEKNKAAMITRLDRDVGALLDQLRRLKIESNTVVFFSSDNGPHREGGVKPEFFHSAGPWRGIKRDLYEGGIRVPMLVRWPGRIAPGTVSDQVWAFCDFLPTAAELAKAPCPEGVDGLSVVPTLLGQKQTNQHEYLYWEFHERGSRQAVRLGDWKGLRLAPDAPLELYNLRADPGETNNVAANHASVVTTIERHLMSARTDSEHWPLRTAPARGPRARPEAKSE